MIDDSAIEFAVLRRILVRGLDWTVEWAHSGEAGLERLRDTSQHWDVVLLDLYMAGMGGLEVLEAMGAEPSLAMVPVVVLTASTDAADQVKALEAGADDFLTKPLVAEIARVRVRAALEMSRRRDYLEAMVRDRAAQMAHTDRLLSLGTLAAGMAHEINNPLTFLSGNLQMLERIEPILREEFASEGSSGSRIERVLDDLPEIVGDMRKGVQRIEKIVASLKPYSRGGGGRREPVDLSQVARGAMALCAHHLKGIGVELSCLMEGTMTVGDPLELEQVVVNLLMNSADAIIGKSPEGGPPKGSILVSAWTQGTRALLSVYDDGPGIPRDALERVGTPFFTTKGPGKGTGLGLSISQGIANSHGGSLSPLASDRGALFLLDLPSLAASKGAAP